MFVCLPLALWAVKTGHRWVPLLLFLAYLVAANLISRMLPQTPAVPIESRQILQMLTRTLRFLGFVFGAGCIAAALSLPFGGFRGLPRWAVVLTLAWWSLWALACFWAAKGLRSKANHAMIKIGQDADH